MKIYELLPIALSGDRLKRRKLVNLPHFYKEVVQLTDITNHSKVIEFVGFLLGWKRITHVSILKEVVTINQAVHLALTTAHFKIRKAEN